MEKVWISFNGDEPRKFQFATLAELNAFLRGLESMSQNSGFCDFSQYNSEEEFVDIW